MRMICERECKEITGLGRTVRWSLEKKGKFPKRRIMSDCRIAWLSTEIEDWMKNLSTDAKVFDRRKNLKKDKNVSKNDE